MTLTWHHSVARPASATSCTVTSDPCVSSTGTSTREPCCFCLREEEPVRGAGLVQKLLQARRYLRRRTDADWPSFCPTCVFSCWTDVSGGTDRARL